MRRPRESYVQKESETIRTHTQSQYEECRDTLQNLGKEQWIACKIQSSKNIEEIVKSIRGGTAIAVSDGSFKDEHGTAAWVIEDYLAKERLLGLTMVPSFPIDQSAYRSEVAGLYAIVKVISIIIEVYNITEAQAGITIRCDGLSALERSFDINNPTSISNKHYDLLSGIQGMVKATQIKWEYHHVRGHQKEKKEKLTRWEMLNEEMDIRAKLFGRKL